MTWKEKINYRSIFISLNKDVHHNFYFLSNEE